jgi:hypothetical protein
MTTRLPHRGGGPPNGGGGAPPPLSARRSAARWGATGPGRLRGVRTTTGGPVRAQGPQVPGAGPPVATDAYASSHHLARPPTTRTQGQRAWARADAGAGIRAVPTTACAGLGAGRRTLLRPCRGVQQRFLRGYVASHAWRVNRKRITVTFIATLVSLHSLYG